MSVPYSSQIDPAKLAIGSRIAASFRRKKANNDELEIREYLQLAGGQTSPLTVQRVFGQKNREVLCREVAAIYKLIKEQASYTDSPLKNTNTRLWELIDFNIDDDRYLPIVVRNRSKKLQAIALVRRSRSASVLSFVVTAPHNLSELGPNRHYRGAGTADIANAVRLCQRWGCTSFEINRMANSIPFYEKIGITSDRFPASEFPDFLSRYGAIAEPIF